MPLELKRLLISQTLGWLAFFSTTLFFTDFIGQVYTKKMNTTFVILLKISNFSIYFINDSRQFTTENPQLPPIALNSIIITMAQKWAAGVYLLTHSRPPFQLVRDSILIMTKKKM